MKEKYAVFVYVTNVTQINNINIYRCVVFGVCQEEKEERERKSGKWCNLAPPIFYYFENTTNPYFLSFVLQLVCVFVLRMESRIKVVLSVCSGRECLVYSLVNIFRSWKKFDLAIKKYCICLFVFGESRIFAVFKDRVLPIMKAQNMFNI